MILRHSVATVALLSATVAGTGHAQVLQQPPRQAAAPLPSARAGQTLAVQVDVLGSYQDGGAGAASAGASAGIPLFGGATSGVIQNGSAGIGTAVLRYGFGTPERGLTVAGRAFTTTLGSRTDRLKYGGDASVQGRSSLGQRTNAGVAVALRSEPMSDLGIFGALPGDALNHPGVNPLNGFLSRRSVTSSTNATLKREWTRRFRTELGYGWQQKTFEDNAGFDQTTHNGSFSVDRSVGRGGGVKSDYRYSRSSYLQADGVVRSLATHSVNGGFRTEIARSRTRSLSINAQAGAVYADRFNPLTNQRIAQWAPSAGASVAVDLGQSWSADGSYQRSYSVLQGAQPVVYLTDAVIGSIGGRLGRRLESTFSVAHSNGRGDPAPQGANDVAYLGTTGTGQLRFLLTQRLNATVAYSHFRYRLDDPASLAAGIVRQFHRNSARVGLTWSQPLIGPRARR